MFQKGKGQHFKPIISFCTINQILKDYRKNVYYGERNKLKLAG